MEKRLDGIKRAKDPTEKREFRQESALERMLGRAEEIGVFADDRLGVHEEIEDIVGPPAQRDWC